MFANAAVALSFLKEPTTPREKLYAGYHYRNPTVHRSGKWEISHEEFSGTHYPDFCFGFGYILSHVVVGLFVETFPSLPFFRLDDVYVGMLGSKTGIKITHNKGFELDTPKEWRCIPKASTFVRHNVEGNCQLQMFNRASNF